MTKDTRRSFQKTLLDIQKRYGDKVVQTLAQHDRVPDGIPTGFATLDQILSNRGIARGRITTFIGSPTCGITTLALQVLGRAQGSADAGVYLDLLGTYDPDYAALHAVAADRLLLAQPDSPFQAVEIARDLAKSGRAALIVVDMLLGRTATEYADLAQPLHKLHDAVKGQTTVLFLLPAPLPALDVLTQTCLRLERVAWLRERKGVTGYTSRVTVLKDKPQTTVQTTLIDIALDMRVEGDAK